MGNVRTLALWLALASGTSACGGGHTPGVPPDDIDAGPEEDADAADDAGATEDAEVDAQPSVDGGAISECAGDVLEFEAARAVGRPLTAAIVGNRTHLVYLVPSGGGTSGNNTAQGLRYVSFDTSGEPSMPADVVNVGIDSYNRTRDPFLVAKDRDLSLVYTATADGNPFELYSKDLDANADPVRETSSNTRVESATFAGLFAGSVAAVYSADSATPNTAAPVLLQLLGQPAREVVAESAGYHAAQLAYATFGDGSAMRSVVTFLSDLESHGGMYAQQLDATGAPSGSLTTLSTQIGGTSAIDITTGKDGGGAIVYTEAPAASIHQLRFREVGSDGKVSTLVKNLTSANQNLRDISIAAYSHGYVIAYRRVGGLPNAQATIYLLFVDAQGNISGTRLVREAALTGGGLKVLVANDGRLIVLWADNETMTNPTTNKAEIGLRLRAARLTCAM